MPAEVDGVPVTQIDCRTFNRSSVSNIGMKTGSYIEILRDRILSEDSGHMTIMSDRFEDLDRFRRLHRLSRVKMGKLCLACIVYEDIVGDNEDFDNMAKMTKENVMKALRRPSLRHPHPHSVWRRRMPSSG